jgi:phosphatidylinositol alpha-1,6-mannosyltransferase
MLPAVTKALLLTPSRGLGGGIERVADGVERGWPEGLRRVDLAGTTPAAKLAFAWRASAVAARRRPDVVLCLHAELLPVAAAAAAAGGARCALMGMGREVWAPMDAPRRALVRRCSRVLAISPYTAEWLARRAGLEPDAVRVVALPVDERFARAAAQGDGGARHAGDGLRLLTVSRITSECRYKGHFAVAEAVARLVREGRRVRWTVVGHGDDLPVLRERCAALGLEGHAELLGRVDDAELERRYREADAFVLPSVADPEAVPPVGEGFGLVYAEAGAFGVPSVASASGGGSSAFVADGQTGLTVAPGSVEQLAAALARLDEDPDLRRRLGEAARRRVLAYHLPGQFGPALRRALA